jgi:hypothetical protein
LFCLYGEFRYTDFVNIELKYSHEGVVFIQLPEGTIKDNSMKVFLSFSGEMSHNVASELHKWLLKVIQSVKAFISEDIEKGKPWYDQIGDELNRTTYGIICVTPYNFKAPWINFEADAISKAVQSSRVTPFLFRVDSSTIRGPLQEF